MLHVDAVEKSLELVNLPFNEPMKQELHSVHGLCFTTTAKDQINTTAQIFED